METKKSDTEQAHNEAIKRADEWYRSKEDKPSNERTLVENIHDFLLHYKECKNPELLWRLARASRDLANLSVTDTARKKSFLFEARKYADQALKFDDENYACHMWYGTTMGDIREYVGAKQKISNAYKIQNHFKKAVEFNPLNARCHYLLGQWCFGVANISWYKRKIADALVDTLPSSSFEEAIGYFGQAERLNPNFYCTNQLMIAKSYLRLGKRAEARPWLLKLVEFDAKIEKDESVKNEAKELLKSAD